MCDDVLLMAWLLTINIYYYWLWLFFVLWRGVVLLMADWPGYY